MKNSEATLVNKDEDKQVELFDLIEKFNNSLTILLEGNTSDHHLVGVEKPKNGFQQNLNFLLTNYGTNLFSTEEGCLLAKITLFFGGTALNSERMSFLIEGLKKHHDNFPIISQLDSNIRQVRRVIFDFFEEYKNNRDPHQENFVLVKTGNKLADQIIKTDINRMIASQNNHFAGKGPDNTFEIDVKEFEDKFIINLRR